MLVRLLLSSAGRGKWAGSSLSSSSSSSSLLSPAETRFDFPSSGPTPAADSVTASSASTGVDYIHIMYIILPLIYVLLVCVY